MNIVFYNDVKGYGGHEKTSIDAVKYLIHHTDNQVTYILYRHNEMLKKKLIEIQNHQLDIIEISYYTGKLSRILNYIHLPKQLQLLKLVNSLYPDKLIAVQGNIEISSLLLLIRKRLGIPVISFIPLTQSFSLSSSRWMGRIRDLLAKYLYSLPDSYITISHSLQEELVSYHIPPSKIDVIYCGVDLDVVSKDYVPYHFQKDKHHPIRLGMIGRIKLAQKNFQMAIEALNLYYQKIPDFRLIIIGDGPDKPILEDLIAKSTIKDNIEFLPWNDNPSNMYSQIDILLIPSLFEGVPLVQYEAMYYQKPIVASNRDGMKELLPPAWLHGVNDNEGLIRAIMNVLDDTTIDKVLNQHHDAILKDYNTDVFGKKFYLSILNRKLIQGCNIK